MKPRSSKVERPNGRPARSTPVLPADRSSAEAQELAETRRALDRAREQIDLEVERRQKTHQAFEQLVSTERERMRKQLHDGLGQVLTSISFLASGLRARLRKCGDGDAAELDEIILLINEAIAESRAIAAACDNATRSTAQMIS